MPMLCLEVSIFYASKEFVMYVFDPCIFFKYFKHDFDKNTYFVVKITEEIT